MAQTGLASAKPMMVKTGPGPIDTLPAIGQERVDAACRTKDLTQAGQGRRQTQKALQVQTELVQSDQRRWAQDRIGAVVMDP